MRRVWFSEISFPTGRTRGIGALDYTGTSSVMTTHLQASMRTTLLFGQSRGPAHCESLAAAVPP